MTGIFRCATRVSNKGHDVCRIPVVSAGITVERSRYSIGSRVLRCETIFQAGDIGESGAAEVGMNAMDQLRPGFCFRESTTSAIESNDVSSCF